jgi:hypothetical protein
VGKGRSTVTFPDDKSYLFDPVGQYKGRTLVPTTVVQYHNENKGTLELKLGNKNRGIKQGKKRKRIKG